MLPLPLRLLLLFLATVWITCLPVDAESLQSISTNIRCGSILRKGQFLLQKDLHCTKPQATYPTFGVQVVAGAVLNLNGHTITCAGAYDQGMYDNCVVVRNATLHSGGVSGEENAISSHNGFIHHVRAFGNVGIVSEDSEHELFMD